MVKNSKIIIACEFSGVVRDAFKNAGYDAISCDIQPTQSPGKHIQADIRSIDLSKFDMLIGFPPCQYLTKAQSWRHENSSEAREKTKDAVEFFKYLYFSPCKLVALENPAGYLTKYFRKADQYIQPYWFGSPHRKLTGLWLKNIPPLIATYYHYKRQSMQNHVNSSMSQALKTNIKSKFHPEVAQAMVNQWRHLL